DMLARDQFRQIVLLLLGIAVAPDLVDAKVRMRSVGQADGARSARDLLHGDTMGEIAEPRAAPFLFDRDSKKAERPELRPKLARKAVRAVDFGGVRRNLILRKVDDRITQHADIAAEVEIKPRKPVRYHDALHPATLAGAGFRLIDSGWLQACQRRNASPTPPRNEPGEPAPCRSPRLGPDGRTD